MTDRGLDLTSAQLAVWLGQYMRPESPAYNHGMTRLIEGPLDISRFEGSLRATVDDTEALNFVFIRDGERVVQVDRVWPTRPLRIIDMRGESDPLDTATQWCLRDLNTCVDLSRGPLFEQVLFTLGADRHLWYQRFHHILIDGLGEYFVADQVARRYSAGSGGAGLDACGPLEHVVNDERGYLDSQQYRDDREFWLNRLTRRADAPVLSESSAIPSGLLHRKFGSVHVEPLNVVGRRAGGTWAHAAMAAVALLVGRASGVDEVVLGVPVLPRPTDPSVAQIPSMRINLVALPVPCHEELGLTAIIQAVVKEMRENRLHRRYPIERLKRDLYGRRLYGPVVNLMPYARDVEFAGCRTTTRNLASGFKSLEDIAIHMFARTEQRFELNVEANADAYTEGAVGQHFNQVLEIMKMRGEI
ncbi:condensation domain-containing protein [Streptomyces virginiae]|uniref:condensation domain-containing protein n=1 Tax=Streptomyces virginiae TaxID=1961 RepID=UPI003673DC25